MEELKIISIKGVKGISSTKGDNKQEQVIIDLLQDQNLHFDELIKWSGFSSSQLGIILSLIELKGIVKSFLRRKLRFDNTRKVKYTGK